MKAINTPKAPSSRPFAAAINRIETILDRVSSARSVRWSVLLLLVACSIPVRAGTPEIIGTWKYSETVQLEFKADGKILSNSRPAGSWGQREKITEYLIILNDQSRHVASLDKYKRTLTSENRAHGAKKIMSRIDGGPTMNPDVPDERTAWTMESADLGESIKQSQAGVEAARREAAEFWQKHRTARAIGRISSWNIEAERAEARARNLEQAASTSHMRLVELKSKLGIK